MRGLFFFPARSHCYILNSCFRTEFCNPLHTNTAPIGLNWHPYFCFITGWCFFPLSGCTTCLYAYSRPLPVGLYSCCLTVLGPGSIPLTSLNQFRSLFLPLTSVSARLVQRVGSRFAYFSPDCTCCLGCPLFPLISVMRDVSAGMSS